MANETPCSLDINPDYWVTLMHVNKARLSYYITVFIGAIIFISIFPALPFFIMLSVILASIKYFALKMRNL